MPKPCLKLTLITFVAITFCSVSLAAERVRPVDNDAYYKLPAYVPEAAMPKTNAKVVFDKKALDNDELYTVPKKAVTYTAQTKPAAAQPAAQPVAAQPAAGTANSDYQRQYEEYQRQMQIYNQQMNEYNRAVEMQRQAQQRQQMAPRDNDSTYVLPGQYSPNRNQAARPAQQQYNQQRQQQYYQQYDNTDYTPPKKSTDVMPNYYY